MEYAGKSPNGGFSHSSPRLFPAAPQRPEKKGSVQSIPVIPVGVATVSSKSGIKNGNDAAGLPGNDCCAVCAKDLSHLDNLRKVAHTNKCLDAQESASNYAKAKDKWNSTIDCPMCGEPQPPGPHRSAHAKRCGKLYNVAPKELLKLMNTQQRVSEAKKRHNLLHTKAPLPMKKEVVPLKLHGEPTSILDESVQFAKALSASMDKRFNEGASNASPQYTRLVDPNDGRRRRPRSYAVVELAPRSCRCDIIQKVHDRFLEAFRVRNTSGAVYSHAEMCKRREGQTRHLMESQYRLMGKLERLDRLSQDLYVLAGQKSTSDVRIRCDDGSAFRQLDVMSSMGVGYVDAHRLFLRLRTKLLHICSSQDSCADVTVEATQKIVLMWLRYVYSGQVEWGEDDVETVFQLAEKYGPEDLPPFCLRMMRKSRLSEPRDSINEDEECRSEVGGGVTTVMSPSRGVNKSSYGHPSKTEVKVPEKLKINLNVTGSAAITADGTIDNEDPLQGILNETLSSEPSVVGEDFDVEERLTESTEGDIHEVVKPILIEKTSRPESGEEIREDPAVVGLHKEVVTAESRDMGAAEITMLDFVDEIETSKASNSSHSPDLFDDKEKVLVKGDRKAEPRFTPLREPALRHVSLETQPLSDSDKRIAPPSVDINVHYERRTEEYERSPRTNTEGAEDSDSDVVYVGEEQKQLFVADDSYSNECFDYHDPFMEPWYDPMQTDALPASTNPMEDVSVTSPKNSRRSASPLRVASATQVDVQKRNTEVRALTQDSFFDTPVVQKNVTTAPECLASTSLASPVSLQAPREIPSTPSQPARKKARFGSNVKILKTSGITPTPNYNSMSDDDLKKELARFGLKPMGRKRAVAMLQKIYNEIHPEVDPNTPTLRPLVVESSCGNTPTSSHVSSVGNRRKRGKAIKMPAYEVDVASLTRPTGGTRVGNVGGSDDDDFMDLGDKTLNAPREGPLEETMIDYECLPPKDLDGMVEVFLAWLRRPENDELYNHLLSLQPVQFEELYLRMSRANSAVCAIPKKALANVLDHLCITFSFPQKYHGARRVPRRTGKR